MPPGRDHRRPASCVSVRGRIPSAAFRSGNRLRLRPRLCSRATAADSSVGSTRRPRAEAERRQMHPCQGLHRVARSAPRSIASVPRRPRRATPGAAEPREDDAQAPGWRRCCRRCCSVIRRAVRTRLRHRLRAEPWRRRAGAHAASPTAGPTLLASTAISRAARSSIARSVSRCGSRRSPRRWRSSAASRSRC